MAYHRKAPEPHFWITNISKKSVSLADLNLTIQPNRSMNLLDKKHFSFTEEQLIQSAQTGSLHKKSHMVAVRILPPAQTKQDFLPIKADAVFQTQKRSSVEINKVEYEELAVSDDQYASDNAELADPDVGKSKK